MAGYIDVAYLKSMGSLPSTFIDELLPTDPSDPNVVETTIEGVSRYMDSFLLKRYATPFQEPVPISVKFHCAQIVSHQLRIKVGFDPNSQQDEQIIRLRDEAFDWLKMAASASEGLVELPLREPDPGEKDATGVAHQKTQTFSYHNTINWHRAQKYK